MAASVISRLPGRYADMPTGWNIVDHTVSIPTTSLDDVGDDTLCFLFPTPAYLDGQSLHVKASDLDTNATETIDLDFGIGDVDGVIDTNLISDSDIGEDGTYDEADGASGGTLIEKYIDVAGKYMIISVGTNAAATAQAGTVTLNFQWSRNIDATATTA